MSNDASQSVLHEQESDVPVRIITCQFPHRILMEYLQTANVLVVKGNSTHLTLVESFCSRAFPINSHPYMLADQFLSQEFFGLSLKRCLFGVRWPMVNFGQFITQPRYFETPNYRRNLLWLSDARQVDLPFIPSLIFHEDRICTENPGNNDIKVTTVRGCDFHNMFFP